MKSITYVVAFLTTAFSVFNVNAGLVPTFPDGATISHPGEEITILWKEDGQAPLLAALGQVTVKFMTGPDLDQIPLKTIDTVNATEGKLKWVVPVVEPAGKIYFFRFEAGTDIFFTTRFIITDANGQYPPPPNPPPPVGQNKGGNGKIVSDTLPVGGNTGGVGASNNGTNTNTTTTATNPTSDNPNTISTNTKNTKPVNNPAGTGVGSTNTTDTNAAPANSGNQTYPSMSTRTVVGKSLGFGAAIGGMAVSFLAFGGSFI